MFEKFLKRSSWTDIIISLVFVLLGILLVARPNEMMSVITVLLGAVFIIVAFLKLVDYFTSEPKRRLSFNNGINWHYYRCNCFTLSKYYFKHI